MELNTENRVWAWMQADYDDEEDFRIKPIMKR